MRKVFLTCMVLSTFIILFIALLEKKANAIPAFSRKYKTTCMTCHAPYPRLTAFGESYRLNGYMIPEGDDLYIKDEPVSMGAEAYKRVFPKSVWPSDIPNLPPISIRAIGDVIVDAGGTKKNDVDFVFPAEIALLSAGTFGQNFSFFGEIAFEDEEGETDTGISAWLMWDDLFYDFIGENHLNIKAGTVGMQDIALPNSRDHNRITRERYLYSTELNLDSEPGFEVNGFGRNWRYHVGIVESDSDNSEKDPYVALSFKFGGLGYDGSGGASEKEGLTTTPAGYWRDDSVRFGFFAYRSYIGDAADEFDRIGADFRVNYKDLSLAGGYIRGQEDNTNIDKDIWYVEGEYFLYPWMALYCRYENQSVDNADNEDLDRFIPGMAILIRANIKLNVEASLYTENEPAKAAGGETNDDNRVVFRLDWAY